MTHVQTKQTSPAQIQPLPYNALLLAAQNGDAKIIRRLVNDGADIEARDGLGLTPLLVAIRHRHLKAVAELIAAGAKLNVETRSGWTPLTTAVKSGSPQIISLIASATGGRAPA